MGMLHSDVLVIAEVGADPEAWWTAVAASTRAAADAGVNAVRVDPPPSLLTAPLEAWIDLRKAVLRSDVDFLVTVSSPQDVSRFRQVGVGGLAATVGSGEGEAFWDALGAAHLPVFLLFDGQPGEELRRPLEALGCYDVGVTVIFGQPERPASPERLGLGRLEGDVPGPGFVRGFADRSGTGWPLLAACVLGADVLEVPFALSSYLPGPAGALGPEGLRHVVEGARYLAWARAHR